MSNFFKKIYRKIFTSNPANQKYSAQTKKKRTAKALEKDRKAIDVANYMIETNGTTRSVAKYFGVSHGTIYNYITKRLKNVDYDLYKKAKDILNKNKNERNSRGGKARWSNIKKEG